MPYSASNSGPIRLVWVDASPLFVGALRRALALQSEIVLVGVAANGRAGLELIEAARPDVVCCATPLALLPAVELVGAIMSRCPTSILALQSSGTSEERAAPDADQATAAMLAAGAVDWMKRPDAEDLTELFVKIVRAAKVRVFTRRARAAKAEIPNVAIANEAVLNGDVLNAGAITAEVLARRAFKPALIAMGASTGGPPILLELLRVLSPESAPPVLCVQHIARGFLDEMIEWLRAQCRVSIAIAREGEIARAGTVYFPAEDRHLEISGAGRLILSDAPPLNGHRPAVNATFEAVARGYGARAVALLLTGMGADGASGLKAIHDAGGTTWAQAPATCAVAGMPGSAIALGAASAVLTPAEMVARLEKVRA